MPFGIRGPLDPSPSGTGPEQASILDQLRAEPPTLTAMALGVRGLNGSCWVMHASQSKHGRGMREEETVRYVCSLRDNRGNSFVEGCKL